MDSPADAAAPAVTPEIDVADHPLLELRLFVTELPALLGELPSPDWLRALLSLDAPAPLSRHEQVRSAVRDLLRHGGYKPTGRGKPASEYLLRAAGDGALSSINLVVDACNAVSLHSGLPISVVDMARAPAPLRIAIAEPGTRYVFNRGGQEIDVGGLLCLFDAQGPCANGVKDAQRTKTDTATTVTLSVLWGHRALPEQLQAAETWYRELLGRAGARTRAVTPKGEA